MKYEYKPAPEGFESSKIRTSHRPKIYVRSRVRQENMSMLVANLLWDFFGFFGEHNFYLKKVVPGILYLFTGGLAGIGWIIDAFTTASLVNKINEGYAKDLVLEVKMLFHQWGYFLL